MQDTLISFETAKLAKEKGFVDLIGTFRGHYYNHLGELDGDCIESLKPANKNKEEFKLIAAPTQSLLSKWFRENHNKAVSVYPNASGWCWILDKSEGGTKITDYNYSGPNESGCWDTYEEALEAGLLEALKLI